MKYEKENHSKFLLMYHIIFVCRYRKKLLQPIDQELKDLIYLISESSDFEIVEMETDKDHIHLLVKSKPKISVLSIVRKLKQLTTYRLWKTQKQYLKQFYRKENTLWSDGYFACTIRNVSRETLEMYIRNQG